MNEAKLERRNLLDRARAALTTLGHPYVHSAKTIRKLIEDQIGKQQGATEKDLLELFLKAMSAPASAVKVVSVRPYKFDTSMQRAAQRARSVQSSIKGVN